MRCRRLKLPLPGAGQGTVGFTTLAKKLLSGTLEEQCSFLYELAQEKIASGNYTGAVYALKEIVRHKPDFRDAADLLASARKHKRAQTFRLLFSLGGAVVLIGIGSTSGLHGDVWLLALGFSGLLAGYGAANLIQSFART